MLARPGAPHILRTEPQAPEETTVPRAQAMRWKVESRKMIIPHRQTDDGPLPGLFLRLRCESPSSVLEPLGQINRVHCGAPIQGLLMAHSGLKGRASSGRLTKEHNKPPVQNPARAMELSSLTKRASGES